ncbi:MAG: holo-ACP synthase [Deinococcales bacterium]
MSGAKGMIIAVGIDIIELERIEKVWNRYRNRFIERHFTQEEIDYVFSKSNPLPSLAARFAAKEAFQKCWRESYGWKEVWVSRTSRKPELCFSERIQEELDAKSWVAHLSLSHSKEYAVAIVVLESKVNA